tara:strand:- start:57 stop:224 length:168 start_codon:yes stop_codon:yes gene_type:complete
MGSAIMLLHANLRVKVAGQIPTMNTNLVAQYIVRAIAMTGMSNERNVLTLKKFKE